MTLDDLLKLEGVAVAGNRGVFVETAEADFNRLYCSVVGSLSAA